MDKQDYTATIWVEQKPQVVFEAVKNFRAWWSEEIEGDTEKLDEVFFYHYKDVHLCKIKLIKLVPYKELVYHVVDNQFSFTKDKNEWTNTKLIFRISSKGGKTKLLFTHEGLVPDYECYKICYDAWNNYIKKSLYDLITIGKGQPNPKAGDGFNAEIVKKWKLK
ncbi:MAG: SRPBCC domain-containing protein [Bacteroidales bacterium]|nr:SRPBCC domain-containing protein [Bacteroidales bacterium]